MSKLSMKRVHEAIQANGGDLSRAARALRVSRHRLFDYVSRRPQPLAALEDSRFETTDLAQTVLQAAVRRGEPWAVTFALKSLDTRLGLPPVPTSRSEEHSLEERLEGLTDEQLAQLDSLLSFARNGQKSSGAAAAVGVHAVDKA